MTEKTYRMKQITEAVGCSKQTIRNYLKKGLIECTRDEANNYRVFTQATLDKLLAIKIGRANTNDKKQ